MFYIERNISLEKFTIIRLYSMFLHSEIDDMPYYQRYSQLWPVEKKRLLIDSIINGYDMPKFYFHYILSSENKLNPTNKLYAVIDGKQRINTIVDFIDGNFELDETVKSLDNPQLSFNKVSYKTLSQKDEYWDIKQKFDNYQLDIIHIATDEFDRIEEMFLRLNEGIPVNNAEKRNSIGGVLIEEINKFVKEVPFFTRKVRFGNKRMEHQDLALKLALIETSDKISSFTKRNLDNFVKHFKPKKNTLFSEIEYYRGEVNDILNRVYQRLELLSNVFDDKDEMLRYKGTLPLYYYFLKENPEIDIETYRSFLKDFENIRSQNRKIGSKQKSNTTLLQFDRLNQQGAHQAKSLETRLKIMNFYYFDKKSDFSKELPFKEIGIADEDD